MIITQFVILIDSLTKYNQWISDKQMGKMVGQILVKLSQFVIYQTFVDFGVYWRIQIVESILKIACIIVVIPEIVVN